MIHHVLIDDKTMAGKRFMRDFSRKRTGIVFQNPAVTGIIPEGYEPIDVFFEKARKRAHQFCIENGIS